MIEALPDDAASRRLEDWPMRDHLIAAVANEIKAMRADLWSLLGHQRLVYQPIVPPSLQASRRQSASRSRMIHDRMISALTPKGSPHA